MTEITDDLPARLLHEEHANWKALLAGRGGEHFEQAMTRDGIVIVDRAVFDRSGIRAAFSGAAPWDSYEIKEPTIVRLGEHAGIVAYRVVAGHGESTVELRISTTYLYDHGSWKIAAHQHTAA